MIGRVAAFLVCCAVSTAPAQAQDVNVRSGAHDGFTRLALTLPERLSWTLQQTGRKAVLRLDTAPLDFDTSSVFQRIPGTRLSRLRPGKDGTSLVLELACRCDVSGFWHQQRMLVLDIKDPTESGASERPVARRDATAARTPPHSARPRPSSAATDLAIAALPTPDLPTPGSESTILPAARDVLDETRDQLMLQFGRAAARGLLTPQARIPSADKAAPPPPAPDTPDPEAAAGQTPPDPANRGSPEMSNLTARNSFDDAFQDILKAQRGRNGAEHCLPDAYFDVSAWADARPFWAQLGPLRAAMTTETDKLRVDKAVQLAQFYIHFGFGAEALRILDMIPGRRAEIAALHAIASGLEPKQNRAGGPLDTQLDCASDVVLWAIVGRADIPKDEPVDAKSALRAFKALPQHLRAYLGPRLARKFTAANDHDTADHFLRATSHSPSAHSPELMLAQADSDLAKGLQDTATETFERVVQTGTEPSARALIKLVETKYRRNDPISFEIAQLAGAYAKENRNSPLATDLHRAQVIALASAGSFDDAHRLLHAHQIGPGSEKAELRSDFLKLLAQGAEDTTFLRHVLSLPHEEVLKIAPGIGHLVATRLIDLGFPEPAQRIVSADAPPELQRDRRLIRARIALKRAKPRQAEAVLLGLDGEDANLLRAQARSMAGDHGIAGQLYRSAGQTDAALNETWLAGDWQELENSEDPVLSQVGRLLAGTSPAPEGEAGPDTPLERNRRLLEDSGDVREIVGTLLDSKAAPATLPN